MSTQTQMVVYVDVDDTLIRSSGTKRIPMPRVIERVKRLHADHVGCISGSLALALIRGLFITAQ